MSGPVGIIILTVLTTYLMNKSNCDTGIEIIENHAHDTSDVIENNTHDASDVMCQKFSI